MDRQGVSGVNTVTLTVRAVDDKPNLGADSFITPVDQSYLLTPEIVANDWDVDNDLTNEPYDFTFTNPSHGTLNESPDGVVYTPTTSFQGFDTFSYSITDKDGATSDPTSITMLVDSRPVPHDDSLNAGQNKSTSLDVTANDLDPDDALEELKVIITQAPSNGDVSVVNGRVIYTPSQDFVGTDSFGYRLEDPFVGSLEGATVSLNVLEDVAPTAVDDEVATPSNKSVEIHVLDNDTDSDLDTLVAIGTTAPRMGSVTINPDGTITYRPTNALSIGTDSFTYTISDGRGKFSTATVTVEVGLPSL